MTATGRSRLDALKARAAPVLDDSDTVELTPRGRREVQHWAPPPFRGADEAPAG